jgi:hypothetical protein
MASIPPELKSVAAAYSIGCMDSRPDTCPVLPKLLRFTQCIDFLPGLRLSRRLRLSIRRRHRSGVFSGESGILLE